jgi:hypothetical protein
MRVCRVVSGLLDVSTADGGSHGSATSRAKNTQELTLTKTTPMPVEYILRRPHHTYLGSRGLLVCSPHRTPLEHALEPSERSFSGSPEVLTANYRVWVRCDRLRDSLSGSIGRIGPTCNSDPTRRFELQKRGVVRTSFVLYILSVRVDITRSLTRSCRL